MRKLKCCIIEYNLNGKIHKKPGDHADLSDLVRIRTNDRAPKAYSSIQFQ
jgi:hypothetical protein